MLYATTRSDLNLYSPQQVLKECSAPDGGLYYPAELKTFSRQDLEVLFCGTTAEIFTAIVNYFFDTDLNAKDVEFTIGKQLAKLHHMNHRITVAECWRNLDGDFSRIERLTAKLLSQDKENITVSEWLKVVCRIALLFCLFGQIRQDSSVGSKDSLDVVVLSADFSGPVAAGIGRKMGLPIGNIVCSCNDNDALWELFRFGQMRTDSTVIPTGTPKCDIPCPRGLERLLRMNLGAGEAGKFAFASQTGMSYSVGKEFPDPFPGFYISVINNRRLAGVIANVHATNGYLLCPYSAMLYAGLMDYRANTGSSGHALMISESSPAQCHEAVDQALQLRERPDM